MSDFKNKTVLITGGASGIGKIMSRLSLQRGANVIVWDINQQAMNVMASEFSNFGNIECMRVDISKNSEIKTAAEQVLENKGGVDILINNAGIVIGKYFHDHRDLDITATMQINALTPMQITAEFLKTMMKNDAGHICNIASAGGMIGNPKMSVYAASKWALIGWSESLRLEMRELQKSIHVTTVLPYYIRTGMFAGVKSKIAILDPEVVSKKIIKSIEKNKTIITLPRYLYPLTRISQGVLSTRLFDWVAGSVLGIYKTMEHFTGRKKE